MKILKVVSILILLGIFYSSCSSNKKSSSNLLGSSIKESNDTNDDYDTIKLTPNESFFSPVGTLRANLRDKITGNKYNKFEYYDYITQWKILTDTIVYGLNIQTTGDLIVQLSMEVPDNQNGSKVEIYLGGNSKEFTVNKTDSESTYALQDKVVFNGVGVGFYELKLKLKTLNTLGESIGQLKDIVITGPAAKNSKSVMRRYRAKAVHCKWGTASTNPVEISVHELSIASKFQNFYQPITTPFGYTGSTWKSGTQSFGGYNFSLWSYGANDPVPPFYQESHLIAVGPNLEFGSYGHEGTGVKPRGKHPYVGNNTSVQTIAVRKLPGETYDTYWSYYLDPNDGHWKLYGCGRKYNKSGKINYLWTGAFVEVPGPASKVRNGHRISETHYRGWQMDTSKKWHPINTMIGTTSKNGLSFRDWKIVDNKFSMQMGGWGEPDIEKKTLIINNPSPVPYYLKGEYLNELYNMPAIFKHNAPIKTTKNYAELSFNIMDIGTNAEAKLFWGTEEGLTKVDKWQNSKDIEISLGLNTIKLNNLEEKTEYFYRVQIKNNEGITWSLDTQKFKTK